MLESSSDATRHESCLKIGKKAKTYVLDTNVLLHDPHCLFKFDDNNLVIPIETLEELDAIKMEQSSERGRNARRVHRMLRELLPDSRAMLEGVPLDSGGTLSVVINKYLQGTAKVPAKIASLGSILDFEKKDNRIIATALFVQENFPPPATLVTKDINMQLKARAVGLESEDYLNDKAVEEPDEQSYHRIPVSKYDLQRFASEGEFELSEEVAKKLVLNEYVLLFTEEGKTMPARLYNEKVLRKLSVPNMLKAPGGIPIRARNLEQQFFLDALMDDSISLITCYGKAGTGKTLLSTVAAIQQIVSPNSQHDGLSISRPVIGVGKEIGFLPGSLEEKMNPWLQPYYDALEVLIPSKQPKEPQFENKRQRKNGKESPRDRDPVQKPYQKLLDTGLVEIEALCFIRGRSIARRFFILDEAQQLTPHQVKTVITRISEGSKIVLIGDPAQIDNPYVDSRSNGLVYCANRMRGQAIFAHVQLSKGERSPLAELAADLL